MNRRHAIAAIGALAAGRALPAQTASPAMAVVLDANSGKLLDSRRLDTAARVLAPPGSTLKPLVLAALLESGKIRTSEAVPCSGKLSIQGRSFACVHPRITTRLDIASALAYSCNEFVAQAATYFSPAELASALTHSGITTRTQLARTEATGHIEHVSGAQLQLQALGESHVEITVLGLAQAYRMLALKLAKGAHPAILNGMEGAVEYGTAQLAQFRGARVAGKTGSAGNGRWAWFAGFAPSRQPKAIVAVLTQGSSGGADSAPLGGELLRAALEKLA